MKFSEQRIVVTGMGLVTPLGDGVAVNTRALEEGRSGLRLLGEHLRGEAPVHVAGLVPEEGEGAFSADAYLDKRSRRRMDRFIHFAVAAADQALADAGWQPVREEEMTRSGTFIASGIGGFPAIADACRGLEAGRIRRLSPFFIPSFLANLAAGQVSIRHHLKGPLHTAVTACAAGAQAIAEAAKAILFGECDVAVAGGAEACIDPVSLLGFAGAGAIATGDKKNPARSSRPFDAARAGFVMGEGAGIVVLERLDHAQRRGARVYAELSGFGESADAHHVTAPPESGEGAYRAMKAALKRAGLGAGDIGYINAHATATQVGDAAEIAAIRRLFGAGVGRVSVSSTKSATGHLLGAAGAVEAIYAILALCRGFMPPTLNLETVDETCQGPAHVALRASAARLKAVMSNAFGFGGVNASLIFSRC